MATVSRVVCATLVALLALLAVAGASTLTLFDGNFGSGCVGNVEVISTCGVCHSINSTMQGGYYFSYTQGYGHLYSGDACAGTTEKLTDDVWSCTRFEYASALISCASSPWDITARP